MKRSVTIARPKTPLRATLEPFAFVHINKCAGSSIEIALGIPKSHSSAAEMRTEMGEVEWARRLSFAVVRHPVDRMVAVYFHRLRIGQGGLDRKYLTLDDWVRAVFVDRDPVYNEGTPYLGPAATWVSDGTGVIVDEILRFEQLDLDWPRVATRLGVCPVLPFLNVNPHEPWNEALPPKGKQIVADALSEDIDLFGYKI